jgi:hypothetical protein
MTNIAGSCLCGNLRRMASSFANLTEGSSSRALVESQEAAKAKWCCSPVRPVSRLKCDDEVLAVAANGYHCR